MEKIKLGILGNGYLSDIIAQAWQDGLLPEYELIGIAGRTKEKTDAIAAKFGVPAYYSAAALVNAKPQIIAEAASVASVKEIAVEALSRGISMAVLSIGALADEAFRLAVQEAAKKGGAKMHIASGAIGGFDVLRTIALMGQAKVSFETHKGPGSLQNTPLYKEEMADTAVQAFAGTATEAIALLPTKVNVAVAASLAAADPARTQVSIHSVPGFVGDDHKITAEIDGVKAVLDIYSSTSAIAGWSVVSLLQNLVNPIMF